MYTVVSGTKGAPDLGEMILTTSLMSRQYLSTLPGKLKNHTCISTDQYELLSNVLFVLFPASCNIH